MAQRIVTNNPMVRDKLADKVEVEYHKTDFLGILQIIRNHVHAGEILLTHPLSGSVKPNETPYKSVLLDSSEHKTTDFNSVQLIESAQETAEKFIRLRPNYVERMTPKIHEDCQLIDYTLIISSFPSAGINLH